MLRSLLPNVTSDANLCLYSESLPFPGNDKENMNFHFISVLK